MQDIVWSREKINSVKNSIKELEKVINSHRIARMATVDDSGIPLVVPICFVCHSEHIYTPVDKKTKKVTYEKLRRVRNIAQNPNVSIVIDKYTEDWSGIYYIIIEGKASLIKEGHEYQNCLKLLTRKYDQYLKMGLDKLGLPIIKITPEKIMSWGN